MIDIKINITNKIANAIGTPFIVCGNSDYTVTFTFDAEWGAYQEKTARFFFVSDGIEQYIDVLFSGNTCNAPVLPNIEKVLIGVYTGDLHTTTGAEVRCKRSILFGGKVHEPPTTEDVYNEILEIVSKKLGSEGGTVTGDYTYNGNTFIHEGNLDLVEPKINEVLASEKLVETATGSAITIDSENAPLQQLKLLGKTEQDVKSVGDSGSFEVGVYGSNLFEPIERSVTAYGVNVVTDKSGTVTVKGTATQSHSLQLGFLRGSGKFTIVANYNGEKNESYININPNGDKWEYIYDNAVTFEKKTSEAKSVNLVFPTGTCDFTMKIMINVGETALPYEPCNKQSITFTDTLRGVGEVADEKDFARGVTTQRFDIVDLGTLTWSVVGNCLRSLDLQSTVYIDYNNPLLLAEKYIVKGWGNVGSEPTLTMNGTGGICVYNTDTTVTPSGLLVYALKTPIETPLSETELNAYRQLMTNKGTTTILSEADMEISYYVNKPNAQAIGNIHSQLNKDYFKLQQAIIEIGGN